jgi:isoquinoline 1-oxidoreductase subunit alpha
MTHEMNVNGRSVAVDAPPEMPLLWVLRDVLGLTGTKFGCGMGVCGACTIHVDGQALRSCVTPLIAAIGKRVTTIEALGNEALGRRLQNAWLQSGVPQCGYCQPGQLMSASALLRATPKPTDAEIDAAMSGNLCRCGTYTRIRAAIKSAAELTAGAK